MVCPRSGYEIHVPYFAARILQREQLAFAVEFEYTAAAFGTVQINNIAKITDASELANFRTNLQVYFF